MPAEFVGENGPEPYIRPAVPVIPGPDGAAKVRCKWCSSALDVLNGVFVCLPCDLVRGNP